MPEHCGVQQLPELVQVWPGPQAQSWGQLVQVSPLWHEPLPQTTSATQLPLWQLWPEGHGQ